ncbi:MAG: hemerythrin domain-containing protein [Desulfovibrionales bacterium]
MQIFKRLLEEHEEIREMIKEYERAGSLDERRKRFEKVFIETTAHHRAEEKALFNKTKDMDEYRDDSLESLEEHHLLDVILGEMQETNMEDDRFTAKFKVFTEFLEDHFEEEEEDQFPEMKKGIDQDTQQKWADEYEEQEEKIKKSLQKDTAPA